MSNLKKLGAFAFVSALILTGCGKKTVVCTQEENEGGEKTKLQIIGNLKSNKVDSVTVKYTFEKEESAQSYCSLMKLAQSEMGDVKIECKNNVITISNYEKAEPDLKLTGTTKDEFIDAVKKAAKDDNSEVTCK